jgi:hypothetical protein
MYIHTHDCIPFWNLDENFGNRESHSTQKVGRDVSVGYWTKIYEKSCSLTNRYFSNENINQEYYSIWI